MCNDTAFVIRIWQKSKFDAFAKSLRYSPGTDNEIKTSYQEGLAAVGSKTHAPKLVWEPDVSKEDAFELCRMIESTPIALTGGTPRFMSPCQNGLEFSKGVLRFSADWEPGRPNNDALAEIWRKVNSILTM